MELDMLNLKYIWKSKGLGNAKPIVKKKKKNQMEVPSSQISKLNMKP